MPAASSSMDPELFGFLSPDFFDLAPLRSPAPSRSSLSKSLSSASSDEADLEAAFGGCSFVDGSSPRTRTTLNMKEVTSAAIARRLARSRALLISLPPQQHPARPQDRAR